MSPPAPPPPAPLSPLLVEPLVRAALLEDLGRAGDLTSDALIPADATARAVLQAREAGVVAGLPFAETALRLVDPRLSLTVLKPDGARLLPGEDIAVVEGPARGLLTAERVALNFLGHLSGVASATRAIADAIAHTPARIADTRKTTPGLRAAEKHAVRLGGGANHRFGLDDAVLIKDNHIAAVGSLHEAVRRARAYVGHLMKIEVEVDTLDQLAEALVAGVEAVLLDNMAPATLKEAVAMTQSRAVLEASGRITLETAPAIAESGVDLLSAGWLTHSARVLDIGLDYRA